MAPTDFIWNHVRGGQQSLSWSETTRLSVGLRGLSWSETPRLSVGLRGLSWSETPRLSVGLRVQMRRRVAGDDPRTDQNNDGKGVKRAEVPPTKLSWLPGGCFSVWSSVCVSGSWSCTCLLSVPVLGAGWWSRAPWPLPSWLAAAPVFLVPASVLVFARKGDVPRTDPVVPLPVRYWSVDIKGVFLRWYSFDDFWQSVSARSQPTGGGRTSACRAGSPWRFTFPSMSLSSLLFASIVRLFQPATSSVGPRPLSEHALYYSPFFYLAFTCRSTAVLTSTTKLFPHSFTENGF